MDANSDLEKIMGWNERLELLAESQGRYLERLRDHGFDTEQAFVLVRDWSHQVWDWTIRSGAEAAQSGAASMPPSFVLPGPDETSSDPTSVAPDEEYLILDLEELMNEAEGGSVTDLDSRRQQRDGDEAREDAA